MKYPIRYLNICIHCIMFKIILNILKSSNIHNFFVVKIAKILFVTFYIIYDTVIIYSHLSVPSTPEFPTSLCTSVPPAMFPDLPSLPKELLFLMVVQ